MHSYLKEFGGEFEIYYRAFDDARVEMDDDIEVEYVRQPYLTVTGSPMQRVEQVLNYIK